MKFLKIVLIILAIIGAVFLIGAEFLPNTYSVSRTAIIKAEDSVVYKNVIDFKNFVKWNPWSRLEPTAYIDISGEAGTPGHLYRWSGKESGKGHMKIQEVKPYEGADFQLVFEKPFQSEAQNHFTFERVNEGTSITWSMQGQSDAALDKWMYLAMDRMIGKDFDKGLENLKELSESQQ